MRPSRHGEVSVSPKICSLALDEVELEEQDIDHFGERCFEPDLKVIVKRQIENSSSGDDIIRVSGRINVSF